MFINAYANTMPWAIYTQYHAALPTMKTTSMAYLPLTLLKNKSCHNASFVVTGGTAGCFYNLRCHQQRQSWHHGNSRFPLHDGVIKWNHFPPSWPFVTGESPAQRPVTRSFDVLYDLYLNKRLSKQSWGWWFETPSRPLWRHRNGYWIPVHTQIPTGMLALRLTSGTSHWHGIYKWCPLGLWSPFYRFLLYQCLVMSLRHGKWRQCGIAPVLGKCLQRCMKQHVILDHVITVPNWNLLQLG